MPPDATHELLSQRAEMLETRSRDDVELGEITAALESRLSTRPQIRRIVLGGDPEGDAEARRLAALEPVNPLDGEADLLDRFERDRRVFALVHESLGELPANILWVALTQGIPERLGSVLAPDAPTIEADDADTAVYYSIWNVQPGLAGMGGGRELIEATAAHLGAELPNLRTHVTLSPIPGFRRWLRAQGFDDEAAPGDLETLCARYLCSQRSDGRPIDPVARFHLGNGARLL
ncbi:MAG: malonyl-CoA decarboxylase domain-containing protein, partial [Microthrixaceae bacterium]